MLRAEVITICGAPAREEHISLDRAPEGVR